MPAHAPPAALAALARHLRCPNCGAALTKIDRSLRCDHGHSFDVARQGHVALPVPGRALARGDSAAMVAARVAFLGAGHYAPIAREILAAARRVAGWPGDGTGLAVDAGAGSGYYLGTLLDAAAGAGGIALDSSRPALGHAIRAHPRIAGVLCDIWQGLPVRSGAAAVVLNVFAPRNASEIHRILAPRGVLITVTPTARHLQELIPRLGMLEVAADKQERLRFGLTAQLEPADRRSLERKMLLTRPDVAALVAMGPSAHHLAAGDVGRAIEALPAEFPVTASVAIETFRRPPPPAA